jgi:hypothetical protein
MRFIRANLFFLAWGITGAALLAIAVCGAASTAVTDEMQRRVADVVGISALASDPKNEAMIAAKRRWYEQFRREYEGALQEAYRINRREPLLPDIFPVAARAAAGFEFAAAYRRALDGFAESLVTGGLPSPANVEEQRVRLEWLREDTDNGHILELDPTHYAYVVQARRMRCYVGPGSFQVNPALEANTIPSAEQLWFAQVTLWVQQDVVAAIARLNEAAAQTGTEDVPCVEHMPVKRIVRLRVLGYQMPDGLLRFPGSDATGEIGAPFTGHTCDEQFDVVRFSLDVVADQRDVLRLIDEIGKRNFCQCVGADYSAVNDADAQEGYLYGSEPVVRMRLKFETYMARAVYEPLMPAGIRRLLGISGDDG